MRKISASVLSACMLLASAGAMAADEGNKDTMDNKPVPKECMKKDASGKEKVDKDCVKKQAEKNAPGKDGNKSRTTPAPSY